jgi:hypothetical protein
MKLLDLLEILEFEIVSVILTTDIIIMLMLRKTSKKFQKVIGNGRKVDICFKKSDVFLSIYDFSEIIKNISKNFIINKLDLQNCKLDNKKYNISYLDIIFQFCPFLTYLRPSESLKLLS